jgi:hypothetical protein
MTPLPQTGFRPRTPASFPMCACDATRLRKQLRYCILSSLRPHNFKTLIGFGTSFSSRRFIGARVSPACLRPLSQIGFRCPNTAFTLIPFGVG